ncbi:MAG: EFR1 family ferrodoxin [Dysgonamonadaceae bacterium]
MDIVKNIAIYYFSGTGNAKQIAFWFSELAKDRNIDCQCFDITKLRRNTLPTIRPETLIIIVSPVHGFNFPKITLDFIEHFPKGKNGIVLMSTRAGMRIGRWATPGLTGIAFLLSSVILKSKGYKIMGQIPFDMPSNWISIHPALNEKTVEFLCKTNYRCVIQHADKLYSNKTDFLAYRDLIQDILISPVALAYYLFGKFVLAKSFYATPECNQCGLCEKECPVKAIRNSNQQPFWTFKCESCMKCMNSCPQQAIETTHGLWILLILLSSIVTSLICSLLIACFQSMLVNVLLFSTVFLVLLWILYRIQHLLLKNRLLGRLIAFTSLTHYKFWGRYRLKQKKRFDE